MESGNRPFPGMRLLVWGVAGLVGVALAVVASGWHAPQHLVARYLPSGIRDQGVSPEALTRVVADHVVHGHMAKAEQVYRQTMRLHPQDVTLALKLAHLYALDKQRLKAEAVYHKAVALEPSGADELQSFEAALTAYRQAAAFADVAQEPRAQWAELLLYHQQLDEVAQYADELFQRHGSREVGRYFKGRLALARQQVFDAIDTLHQVTRGTPLFAPAQYYLGLAYLQQDNVPLAKDAFARVLALAPEVVEPYHILARLHMQTRDFAQALAVGETLRTVRPNDPGAHRLIGHALLALGEASKALGSLKTLAEQAPADPRGYYDLGLGYRQNHQEQEAHAAFEKALALHPSRLEALSQIVDMALTKGQPEKARERVLSQLRVSPYDPSLYKLLGAIFAAEDAGCGSRRGFFKSKRQLSPQPKAVGTLRTTERAPLGVEPGAWRSEGNF